MKLGKREYDLISLVLKSRIKLMSWFRVLIFVYENGQTIVSFQICHSLYSRFALANDFVLIVFSYRLCASYYIYNYSLYLKGHLQRAQSLFQFWLVSIKFVLKARIKTSIWMIDFSIIGIYSMGSLHFAHRVTLYLKAVFRHDMGCVLTVRLIIYNK